MNKMIKNNDNASSNPTTNEHHQSWTKLTFVAFYMLLPMAGLALLWGRKDLLTKFLLQIDRNCVSVFCPSLSRRQKLLNWASDQLPWSSQQSKISSNGISELWRDGSLLCTIINTIVPGACPNPYRHWKKPPIHAQALAYKYFKLPPLFAEKELSNDLTINQEHNFMHYLYGLQQAINKWPTTTKDFDVVNKFSSQYVARGMGLSTGEQYRKTVFYIYTKNAPTLTTTRTKSDIFVYIRGPYGTKGTATIPTTNNLATIPTIHELRQRLTKNKLSTINNKKTNSFLQNISMNLKSFINNNNNNSNNRNIDHNLNDIQIQIEHEKGRIKIVYLPNNYGIYEINLIVNGELFTGSPFYININENISNIRDSFDRDSINGNNRIPIKTRRILSKTIDCIDEKLIIANNQVRKIAKFHDTQLDEIKEIEINCNSHIDTPDSSICTQDSGIDEHIKINDRIEMITQNHDSINKQQITNEICLVINNRNTSPICDEHIGPEVVSNISEKRKRFNKQNIVNYSTTPTNSSFSTSIENDDGSNNYHKNRRDAFEELSVMNVLETIKQSTRNPLSSTISLPNMTDLRHYEDIFKAKRDYWENLSSSQSSSTTSLIHMNVNKRRQQINHRNMFNNNNNYSSDNNNKNRNVQKQICKSNDNFQSVKFNIKKYKSEEHSLNECAILTIEQRKKHLLKEQYGKEILHKSKQLIGAEAKIDKATIGIETQEQCLPVCERIRQFDNHKVNYQNDGNRMTNSINQSPPKQMDTIKRTTIERFQSPFKRARNYFRNLEDTTPLKLNKITNNNNRKRRRFSFDNGKYNNATNNNNRQGGSLNLQNVSQRFSLNNIYEDVIGGEFAIRRHSFKGIPNKNAVINSLISLNNNQNLLKRHNEYLQQDESNIEYNLFINRGKTKKRRSIRNLFDVNY